MSEPLITIIKPAEGFKLPKIKPVMVIVATIVLAVVSVVTALYLYQRRAEPVTPTAPASKPKAASTTTISDNFDGASLDATKWVTAGDATGATASLAAGKLTINILQQISQTFYAVHTAQVFSGDFQVEVDLESITTGDSGSAELFFTDPGVGAKARISRYKSPSGERIETEFGSVGKTSINLPADTASVKVRIVRIGSTIQTFFYDVSGGLVLLGSNDGSFAGNGIFELMSVVFAPQFPPTTATFDNFTAKVNLAGATAPTPGTPLACTTSFTVLALSPTPTPGGPTPTPTPTPTSTPTPPAGEPNSCNGTCGSNANCTGGLFCYDTGVQKYCRNPLNPTSATCANLPGPTPTPKLPPAGGPTPTPVTLQKAGSVAGTWTVSLVGGALLLLGTILMFAL